MNVGGNPPPRGVFAYIQAAFQRMGCVQKNAVVSQNRRVQQLGNTHLRQQMAVNSGIRQKITWKKFTSWLSSLFCRKVKKVEVQSPREIELQLVQHKYAESEVDVSQDDRLDKQVEEFQKKISQSSDLHPLSVAFYSPEAHQIAAQQEFKNIAKQLAALQDVSTQGEIRDLVLDIHEKLLKMLSGNKNSLSADMINELWQLLLLTALSEEQIPASDLLGSDIQELLLGAEATASMSTLAPENVSRFGRVVVAFDGLKKRLDLVHIENRLIAAQKNSEEITESIKERIDLFDECELRMKSRQFPYIVGELCKIFGANCDLETCKQVLIHAHNPIWCSPRGIETLKNMIQYLEMQNPEDEKIATLQLIVQAATELMK